MLGGKKIKNTLDDSLNVKFVGNLNAWSPIPISKPDLFFFLNGKLLVVSIFTMLY
jgi:hypothetical protein